MDSKSCLASLFASAQPADLPAAPSAIEVLAVEDATRAADRPASVPARTKKPRSRPATQHSRPEDTPERVARTLFVGNVPVATATDKAQRRAFTALFTSLDPPAAIESVRFRSLVSAGPMGGLGKRVAFITGEVHAQRDSCNAYVVLASGEDAGRVRAALNGIVFGGRHLRVDAARGVTNASTPSNAAAEERLPTKRSVFLGNLPLNVSDEAVWALFAQCGAIDYVRVIRDRDTGLGKGFGYVAFVERASVELAVRLAGADCGGRAVRVSKCAKPGYATAKKAFLAKKAAASTASTDAAKQADVSAMQTRGGARDFTGHPKRSSAGGAANAGSANATAATKDGAAKGTRKTRFYKAREPREKRTFGDVFGAATSKACPPREKTEVHPALRRKQLHGMIRLPQLRASRPAL